MTRFLFAVTAATLLCAIATFTCPTASAEAAPSPASANARTAPTDISAARRHYRYVGNRWRVVRPYPTYGYYGPRPRYYRPWPYYAPFPFGFGFGFDPYYW